MAYLHKQVGSTEWSGVLLYKIVSGDFDNIESLVLSAEYVFPMDIGSSAYTEYEASEEYMDMYEVIPGSDPIDGDGQLIIGHIHSHHNMSAFFSGTDMDELVGNSENNMHYLSLIVNFDMKPVAKIATVIEVKKSGSIEIFMKNKFGGIFSHKTPSDSTEKMVLINSADIEMVNVQPVVDQYIIDRLKKIKEDNTKKNTVKIESKGYTSRFPAKDGQFEFGFGERYDDEFSKYYNTPPSNYKPKNSTEKKYIVSNSDLINFLCKLLNTPELNKKHYTPATYIMAFEKEYTTENLEYFLDYIDDECGLEDVCKIIAEVEQLANYRYLPSNQVTTYLETLKTKLPEELGHKYKTVSKLYDIFMKIEKELEDLT